MIKIEIHRTRGKLASLERMRDKAQDAMWSRTPGSGQQWKSAEAAVAAVEADLDKLSDQLGEALGSACPAAYLLLAV